MLPNILAGHFLLTPEFEADHEFYYSWSRSGRDSLYTKDEKVLVKTPRDDAFENLGARIRMAVAEFALGRVFLHAGVVAWRGKALVIPAPSYSGKSTLTAELVRRGALYYSDEYAILDRKGRVSPFPKMISIRGAIDDFTQVDHPVEAFGGQAGIEAIDVGMVLVTKYKARSAWRPRILSSGEGVLEIIQNTVPIRNDPTFALAVLHEVAKSALIVSSKRGEASKVADNILTFFEKNCT
jgi:hypothetical protein